MSTRRNWLYRTVGGGIALAMGAARPTAGQTPTRRLVLVHGRAQGGRGAVEIKAEWLAALGKGAAATGRTLPAGLEVELPHYGETLDKLAEKLAVPLTTDIQLRGAPVNDDFLAFQAEAVEAMRRAAGVTDAEIDQEYGANPKDRGPQNWEWVQAILRAIDKHAGGLTQSAIELFLRDTYVYIKRQTARDAIDAIVRSSLNGPPAVVVAHSLGSVVAYNVLRSEPGSTVPLLVTLGSPLGMRAIRDELDKPLRHPKPVTKWYNAFDERDVVALYPLDERNFAITPPIENFDRVKNHTDNRHSIAGYLDDPEVAKRIVDALVA